MSQSVSKLEAMDVCFLSEGAIATCQGKVDRTLKAITAQEPPPGSLIVSLFIDYRLSTIDYEEQEQANKVSGGMFV